MRDLVFVSLEPWNAIWRRNQFLCAHLAHRFPDMRLLFVESPLFLPHLVRERKRVPSFARRLKRIEEFPNIRVFTPFKPLPNPLPGGRALNEATMRAQIGRAARLVGVRDPLLWLNPFDFGFLTNSLNEYGVVYDITDDWELAAGSEEEKARIERLDREMCRRADLTVVCSRALYDSRKEVAKRLLLLPNGVDAEHYEDVESRDKRPIGTFDEQGAFHLSEGASLPAEPSKGKYDIAHWTRPVFGYTGSLHPERIDLNIVKEIACAFPQGRVVLVGPDHFGEGALAREFKEFPNVFTPGAVSYSSIPLVMAGFDVCIVPHQKSQFVESLNPIKLWEFLAAGKPIVSVDVAGFRDFPGLVRLASDAPSFVAACRDALQEVNACVGISPRVPCQREARRQVAQQHSWNARLDELLDELESTGLIEAEVTA